MTDDGPTPIASPTAGTGSSPVTDGARAVRPETLAAWLFKASTAEPETLEHLRHGLRSMRSRCVRPSYRTRLVAPGDRVLLWLSGADREHRAGLHAHGRTTGVVVDGEVGVELVPLEEPLPRRELLEHPDLAGMEVLRMPAGSNPSFVTPTEWAALSRLRPELSRG